MGQPPVVRQLLDRVKGKLRRGKPAGHSGAPLYDVFPDMEAARRAVPVHRRVGYEAADVAGWYADKLTGPRLPDYPVIHWLGEAVRAGRRRIFEIGGHVGIAFYGFERHVGYPADLAWTIWDVPHVVAAGQVLAKERGEKRLSFVADPADVHEADVLLAAGALQYHPVGMLTTRVRALRAPPEFVILNETPVFDGPSYATHQDLGPVICPYQIFGRAELLAEFAALGYDIADEWHEPRRTIIPGHPERCFEFYTGYCLRRRRGG